MRVLAFLLAAVPVVALAQTAPGQAPHATATAHRTPAVPAAAAKPGATKPGAAKPGATKPGATGHKPPAKPAAAPVKPAAPPPPAVEATPAPRPDKSGLPVPRFAALGSDTVNFRVGPDEKFPIRWIYKRRDLPIMILRDYNNWRLVEDPDGDKGWVHALTLTGRRSAITLAGTHVLRDGASETAAAVAKLQAGVIVHVRACDAGSDWCRVTVGEYGGYVRRAEIWGVLPGEVIQ